MATLENGVMTFSLRVPMSLGKQLEARAAVNRRNRNAEIQMLLEEAIDMHVARDQKLALEMRERKR